MTDRNELLTKLNALRKEMVELDQRAAGIMFTPKHLRADRLAKFKAAFDTKREEEKELMLQLRSLA
jgi:hypothetical protein